MHFTLSYFSTTLKYCRKYSRNSELMVGYDLLKLVKLHSSMGLRNFKSDSI